MKILEDIEAHVSTSNSNCHHPPLKDLVLGGSLHGTTPLLLACHYKDIKLVKHIVEHWGVDLNAAAVYYFDPLERWRESKHVRATPLFVAAKVGGIKILRYLLEKEADVSFKTSEECVYYDGVTPLYAAALYFTGKRAVYSTLICSLLSHGADPNAHPTVIEQPIWMKGSVDALSSLLDHGLNLEQLNSYGETALQHWVNRESMRCEPNLEIDAFTIVKLLVDNGANIMDQDENGFTVILAAVNNENWKIVDYFLEKEGVDRMEKIEAMELAAAIILSKSYNDSEFERAFEYWRQALRLRQMEPVSMPKTPLALKSGQAGEWITSHQLENVINHPEEYNYQSYLVRLRICSRKSWEAVLALLNDSFDDCVEDLGAQGRVVDFIDVLWATWEAIYVLDSNPEDLFWKADYVVRNLIWILWELGMDDPLFNAETFMLPLEVMLAVNDFDSPKILLLVNDYDSSDSHDSYHDSYHNNVDRYLDTTLQLVAFLATLPNEILNKDLRESLRQLVLKNRLGEHGRTLLHMACENCKVEDLPTIRLLLLSRADPNAADETGNLPLHALAHQHGNDAVIQRAAHLLLEYGAQLERGNDDGETAADVWIRSRDQGARLNEPPEWCFKPATVPNLKPLCARVVRSKNVPYDELLLPATLIALIEMRELGG